MKTATHYAKLTIERTCLRCQRTFQSESNRLCPKCNAANSHPDMKYQAAMVPDEQDRHRWNPGQA